jgi:hypothetical protein
VIGLLAAALVIVGAFWARSHRHETPVVEPELLRNRKFALANAAGLLFFAGFGAMLLSSVLFLTGVWHESVLRAGVEIAPGPATAAIFAFITGRLAARYSERVLGALGGVLFAAGGIWWIARVGGTPSYAAEVLPGMMISGAGVGLVIPTMFSAATSTLPPARFATGTAVTSMSRQIGVALGVAVLVAILGTSSAGDVLSRFDDGWAFMAAAGLSAAVAFASLGAVKAPAPAPVTA